MSLFGRAEAARAHFYTGFETSISSGLSVLQALRLLGERRGSLGRAATLARGRLEDGSTLAEALAATRSFAPLEINLVHAGERSGKLDEVLGELARYYDTQSQAIATLHQGFVYPIVLVHLAILLPSLSVWFQVGLGAYLAQAAPALGTLWFALLAVVFGNPLLDQRAPALARLRDGFALYVPYLGGLVRARGAAAYARVLGLLLGAGLPIVEALEQAAGSVRNKAIGAALAEPAARVRRDSCKLAEALRDVPTRILPRLLQEAVLTGEASGKLDSVLARTSDALERQAASRQKTLITMLPIVALLLVGAYVAMTVISFYTERMNSLGL